MIRGVLQCCYTNARGDEEGRAGGWRAVSVSDNIPSDVFEFCNTIHKMNSAQATYKMDESGQILNLFEIDTDGIYMYLTRSQYGLLDSHGRDNVFSHTYIIPWSDEGMVSDPNNFLTIADENFKETEEDAVFESESFIRNQSYELQDVLNELDIDENEYVILIKCVYAKLALIKSSSPLYIQYDGTVDQMKKILYCIYRGLPHFLRKRVSVASCPTRGRSDNKTIVFTENASGYEYNINPANGKNNVLSERHEKIIKNDGFVTFAVENYRDMENGTLGITMEEYFDGIDAKVRELGDAEAADRVLLRLANQMMSGEDVASLSEVKLLIRLDSMLRANINGSDVFYDYMADLADMAVKKGCTLSEDDEKLLNEIVDKTGNEKLRNACNDYNMLQFNRLDEDSAIRKLSILSGSSFNNYKSVMINTEQGRSRLARYYAEYRFSSNMGWYELKDLVNEAGDVVWDDPLHEKMKNHVQYLLARDIGSGNFNSLSSFNDVTVDFLTDQEKNFVLEIVKSDFWNSMDFDKFDFNFAIDGVYKYLACSSSTYMFFDKYGDIPRTFKDLDNINPYINAVNAFFAGNRGRFDEESMQKAIMNLVEFILHTFFQNFQRTDIAEKNVRDITEAAALIVNDKSRVALQNLYSYIVMLRQLKPINYVELEDTFEDDFVTTVRTYEINGEDKVIIKNISEVLLSELKANDRDDNLVPIDTWLLVGEKIYKNPFDVFVKVRPKLVKLPEYDAIVNNSRLLKQTKMSQKAREYIESKGEYKDEVKEWLNILRKSSKKAAKAGNQEQQNDNGYAENYSQMNTQQYDNGYAESYSQMNTQYDNGFSGGYSQQNTTQYDNGFAGGYSQQSQSYSQPYPKPVDQSQYADMGDFMSVDDFAGGTVYDERNTRGQNGGNSQNTGNQYGGSQTGGYDQYGGGQTGGYDQYGGGQTGGYDQYGGGQTGGYNQYGGSQTGGYDQYGGSQTESYDQYGGGQPANNGSGTHMKLKSSGNQDRVKPHVPVPPQGNNANPNNQGGGIPVSADENKKSGLFGGLFGRNKNKK